MLHRQRQRPVRRRRGGKEAHLETVEDPARLLDDALHVDPDLLSARVVHEGLERRSRRQRKEDPGQDPLAAPRREGDDRVLEFQVGRRRHLVGRGRHGPGVEILRRRQPGPHAGRGGPLTPEVEQAVNTRDPVDAPRFLADLQVETAGSDETAKLLVLLQPVLHLGHVEGPLRELGQPELERLVRLRLEEDQVLVLALLRPVAPDLKRPEGLVAVDVLDVVRLPVQKQQLRPDIEERRTRLPDPPAALLDALGDQVAAQKRLDVLAAGRRVQALNPRQLGRRQQVLGSVEKELPLLVAPGGEPPGRLLGGRRRRYDAGSYQEQTAEPRSDPFPSHHDIRYSIQ